MKTECFLPAIVSSEAARQPSESHDQRGVFFSRGWCRTEGVVGSASCEMGGSKVVCYAYAPRPSTKLVTGFESGSVECEVQFAPHIHFDNEDAQSAAQKLLSQKLTDAVSPAILLDRYPKSTIYVAAVVVQSSASDIAALVNCASLALCDSQVEMKDVLAAHCVAIPTNSDGAAPREACAVCIACMPKLDEITSLDCVGQFSPAQLLQVIEKVKRDCDTMRGLIINALSES